MGRLAGLPERTPSVPDVIELVSAASLADQTYAAMKRLIFDFELMPGERFSESAMTERLKVSRTPLRQALQRLQGEGFVLVFPKMGWVVAPIDFDAMEERYDLRTLLECHAVQRICDRTEDCLLDSLEAFWLMPPSERPAQGTLVAERDESFHAALVQASGNREMSRVHHEITERIRIIRRLDFTMSARVDATFDEHAQILQALRRRRASEAERLLRAHIAQSKLEVRKITLDALYSARQRSA
jgi:DNA-binding GntR family transcriptional regulator